MLLMVIVCLTHKISDRLTSAPASCELVLPTHCEHAGNQAGCPEKDIKAIENPCGVSHPPNRADTPLIFRRYR
jgi:hypothetical protein